MITITVETAGQDLNRLIDQVKAGEEVVITQGNEPVAKLVSLKAQRAARTPGRLKGQLNLPDSFFFDPLPEAELRLWSGDRETIPTLLTGC